MKRASELKWKVAYQPGVLSAKGYRGGQLVAEAKVETTGAPAAVRLVADRSTLDADGEDIAVVAVSVVDQQGRIVPAAANPITFKLEGPGRIIGVGNGDPSSHEPDKFVAAPTLRTRALMTGAGRRSPIRTPLICRRFLPVSTIPGGPRPTCAASAARLARTTGRFFARVLGFQRKIWQRQVWSCGSARSTAALRSS